jgi:hypothetical protein
MLNFLELALFLTFIGSFYIYIKINFRNNDTYALLSSIFISIVIIYVFGLFHILHWLPLLQLVLCVFVIRSIRGKKLPEVDKISLLFLFMASFAWLKAVPENFKFVNWDEFVSWGPNIKALTFDDSFYTNFGSNGTMGGGYKSYPPGQQIIQYLLTSKIGWSEQYVVWAQGLILILLISLVLELEFKFLGLRKYLLFVPVITMFYCLGYSFTTVYADGLLAILGLATYSISKDVFVDKQRKSSLLLIAPYIILVLIKPTGIFIAIFVLLMSLLQVEVKVKRGFGEVQQRTVRLHSINCLKKSILPVACILIAYISWQIYVSFHRIETLKFSFSGFQGALVERMISTYKVFFERINEAAIFIQFPGIDRISTVTYSQIIAIFIFLQIAMFLYYFSKKEIPIAVSTVMPSLAGIAYFLLIFVFYSFFIDEYERTSGGSIRRYLGSFLLIVILSGLFELVKILDNYKLSKKGLLFVLLSFQLILPTSQMKVDFINSTPNLELLKERENVEQQAEIVLQNTKRNDSIYYLSQGDMGYYKNVFGYLMMPRKVNFWCWSIGRPIFPGDIWTCDESAAGNLSGFDYVFIGKNDGQLTDQLLTGVKTSNEEKVLATGLYRIEKKSNSLIQVTLVVRLGSTYEQ